MAVRLEVVGTREGTMSSVAPGRVVELNIGGSLFTTTVGTLLNHKNQERLSGASDFNFFSKLFAKESSDACQAKEEDDDPIAGDCDVLRDCHGRLFIDREGSFFAPLLQYLRTGVLCVPKDMCIDGLLREAQFYGFSLPLSQAIRAGDLNPTQEGTVAPLIIDNTYLKREAKSTEASFKAAASIGAAIVDTILAQFKEASDKQQRVQTGWIMERQPPNFADAKFESLSRRVIESASKNKKSGVDASDSAVEDLVLDLTTVYESVASKATQRSSFYKYLDDDDRRKELIAFCETRELSIVVKKFVVVIFFNLGEARFRAAAWSDDYYNSNKSKVHAKVASGYVVYWSLGKFQ